MAYVDIKGKKAGHPSEFISFFPSKIDVVMLNSNLTETKNVVNTEDVSFIYDPKFFNSTQTEFKNIHRFEVYLMHNPQLKNINSSGRNGLNDLTDKEKDFNKSKSIKQARKKVRGYIIANNLKYHWTITYKNVMNDRLIAIRDFQNFISRLRDALKIKIPYVAVLEIQPNRLKNRNEEVLHIHFVTNRYIKKDIINRLWKDGSWVSVWGNNLTETGSYLSKYMGNEDMAKNEKNKKYYLNSHNLKLPQRFQNNFTKFQKIKVMENCDKWLSHMVLDPKTGIKKENGIFCIFENREKYEWYKNFLINEGLI